MSNLIYYERYLPHRLPPGETIFITFRLAGSLPQEALLRLQAETQLAQQRCEQDATLHYTEQKRYFGRFDAQLDAGGCGPTWLRQPAVAAIVQQALHYPDGKGYNLRCYCIMPNHVHLVVALADDTPLLAKTLQLLKGYSSFQVNKLLGLSGAFWQAESYDHVVRSGELDRIVSYVLENPVKAGLVDEWQKWPYSYLAKQ
jgi:putative transposase